MPLSEHDVMEAPSLSHRFSEHADCPVLLYLHGFLGCKEDWDDIAATLGESYSHLQVDLPGHGQSVRDIADTAYTMPGCARTLVNLLDLLNISRCMVISYSMGGRLALYLAVTHPDRFDRLLIESASPGLRTASEREDRIRHDRHVADMIREQDVIPFLDRWYNQPLFATVDRSSTRFHDLIGRRRHAFHREGLAKSLAGMGVGSQPSLWTQLGCLQRPTLFMAGERDAKFTTLACDMAHLCPGGQVAIIPEAGHTVHFEQPAEFCRQAAAFFGATE
jgi:2-succinyl-6-hydroxy-2,4-cyclohexadiene-1-carboxylate synthase